MDKWQELCRKYNCSIANLAIAWILSQGKFINLLSGANTVSEIEQNVKSIQLKLSDEDIKYMRELAESIDK